MSILDKLREPPPKDDKPQDSGPPAPRSRLPDPVSSARGIARIGDTITIRGDVTGAESLVIDCRVEGSVSLENHDLTVGQSGCVSSGISANQVRVEGEVTGDIRGAEKVVVTQTGRVLGNIVAPRVTLEEGAKFKGEIDMDPEPDPVAVRQTLRSPAGPAAAPGATRGAVDDDPAPTPGPSIHPKSIR